MSTRHEEMRAQVRAFHVANPYIYKLFDHFTMQLISRGFSHYSVAGVFERIRWENSNANAEGGNTFKLNNNYRAFYARAWMDKNPAFSDFFRTRTQVSKTDAATSLPQLGPENFA